MSDPQFIQGKVKGFGHKDGANRILLERKDESEFVAVIIGAEIEDLSVGEMKRFPNMVKVDPKNGRDVYEQQEPKEPITRENSKQIDSEGEISPIPKEENVTYDTRLRVAATAYEIAIKTHQEGDDINKSIDEIVTKIYAIAAK